MTDFPDWQAPQAHATAINSTGVPLVRNITIVGTGVAIAPNTVSAPVTYAMPQFAEGYLIEVIPSNPGTRIFACDLVIVHIDASGNELAVEQVTVSNYVNLGNDTAIVRGRLLGTSIKILAQNAASSWINTVTGAVVTADTITLRACALYTYVPGTGKRVPIITAADGLLLPRSNFFTFPATINNSQLAGVLPDYTGACVLTCFTANGGGFSFSPVVSSYSVSFGTSPVSATEFPAVLVNQPVITQFSLPSCFNVATATNKAAVAGTGGFSITIIAADQ